MDKTTIELYIYMSSSDKIIEWLKSEGVKTRNEAIIKLTPYMRDIITASIRLKGNLAGTASCSEKVLRAFKDENNENYSNIR